MTEFDAIVIGSGQGGNPLAYQLAQDGKQVALIERGPLGGTCVNTGCTPTKAMIGSAQVAHYSRNAKRWGVNTELAGVDLPAIVERADEVVAGSRTGWEKAFEKLANFRLYRGSASFTGLREIEVNGERLHASHVFIDTGTTPTIPDIPGIRETPHLTSDDMIRLRDVPPHLLIIGGGYVGLEFAQMYQRFGSEVTVLQHGRQILPREDRDMAEEIQKALEIEGIRFHLDVRIARVEKQGGVRVQFEDGHMVTGSHLMVATGRGPNTRDLQLDRTGVQTNSKGFIQVDDKLQTTAEGTWALGDVTGGPQFTHISYNDFQILYANVYQGKSLSTNDRLLPYAVYTDPTLGRVGMTETEARAQGRKIKIGRKQMSSVARAIERGETEGSMKLIVDAETDLILGAAILSSEGGELVQILSTVMLARQPYTLLKGAIFIHPTLAEGFFGLMDSVK